jgi:threonine dehydratase
VAVVTPVIESRALNTRAGRRVLVKPETLQPVGAFKIRGAYNRIVQLSDEERRRGVVAVSSGNHAQGVALAARMLGAPAIIVMPSDAPAVKAEATRAYGAETRPYDRWTENRDVIAGAIAAERGMTLVHAFDDPHVIAGQGTTGLELIHQAEALEVVMTPVGGGGLISGTALAVRALTPATRVVGAEPEGFDDARRSLETGELARNDPAARSICDALLAPSLGRYTFPLVRQLVDEIVAVSDAEVAEAMRYAFSTLKLVVEPGGAAALAALLAGRVAGAGPVGLVLSGGNVDPALFGKVLAGEI